MIDIPSNKTDNERYKGCEFVCECGHEDCRKIFSYPMSWINADNMRPDFQKFDVLHFDCNYVSEFETFKVLDDAIIVKGK